MGGCMSFCEKGLLFPSKDNSENVEKENVYRDARFKKIQIPQVEKNDIKREKISLELLERRVLDKRQKELEEYNKEEDERQEIQRQLVKEQMNLTKRRDYLREVEEKRELLMNSKRNSKRGIKEQGKKREDPNHFSKNIAEVAKEFPAKKECQKTEEIREEPNSNIKQEQRPSFTKQEKSSIKRIGGLSCISTEEKTVAKSDEEEIEESVKKAKHPIEANPDQKKQSIPKEDIILPEKQLLNESNEHKKEKEDANSTYQKEKLDNISKENEKFDKDKIEKQYLQVVYERDQEDLKTAPHTGQVTAHGTNTKCSEDEIMVEDIQHQKKQEEEEDEEDEQKKQEKIKEIRKSLQQQLTFARSPIQEQEHKKINIGTISQPRSQPSFIQNSMPISHHIHQTQSFNNNMNLINNDETDFSLFLDSHKGSIFYGANYQIGFRDSKFFLDESIIQADKDNTLVNNGDDSDSSSKKEEWVLKKQQSTQDLVNLLQATLLPLELGKNTKQDNIDKINEKGRSESFEKNKDKLNSGKNSVKNFKTQKIDLKQDDRFQKIEAFKQEESPSMQQQQQQQQQQQNNSKNKQDFKKEDKFPKMETFKFEEKQLPLMEKKNSKSKQGSQDNLQPVREEEESLQNRREEFSFCVDEQDDKYQKHSEIYYSMNNNEFQFQEFKRDSEKTASKQQHEIRENQNEKGFKAEQERVDSNLLDNNKCFEDNKEQQEKLKNEIQNQSGDKEIKASNKETSADCSDIQPINQHKNCSLYNSNEGSVHNLPDFGVVTNEKQSFSSSHLEVPIQNQIESEQQYERIKIQEKKENEQVKPESNNTVDNSNNNRSNSDNNNNNDSSSNSDNNKNTRKPSVRNHNDSSNTNNISIVVQDPRNIKTESLVFTIHPISSKLQVKVPSEEDLSTKNDSKDQLLLETQKSIEHTSLLENTNRVIMQKRTYSNPSLFSKQEGQQQALLKNREINETLNALKQSLRNQKVEDASLVNVEEEEVEESKYEKEETKEEEQVEEAKKESKEEEEQELEIGTENEQIEDSLLKDNQQWNRESTLEQSSRLIEEEWRKSSGKNMHASSYFNASKEQLEDNTIFQSALSHFNSQLKFEKEHSQVLKSMSEDDLKRESYYSFRDDTSNSEHFVQRNESFGLKGILHQHIQDRGQNTDDNPFDSSFATPMGSKRESMIVSVPELLQRKSITSSNQIKYFRKSQLNNSQNFYECDSYQLNLINSDTFLNKDLLEHPEKYMQWCQTLNLNNSPFAVLSSEALYQLELIKQETYQDFMFKLQQEFQDNIDLFDVIVDEQDKNRTIFFRSELGLEQERLFIITGEYTVNTTSYANFYNFKNSLASQQKLQAYQEITSLNDDLQNLILLATCSHRLLSKPAEILFLKHFSFLQQNMSEQQQEQMCEIDISLNSEEIERHLKNMKKPNPLQPNLVRGEIFQGNISTFMKQENCLKIQILFEHNFQNHIPVSQARQMYTDMFVQFFQKLDAFFQGE